MDERYTATLKQVDKKIKPGKQSEYDGIDKEIAGIEYKRSTSAGLTLNEEKIMLRKMKDLGKRKSELAGYLKVDVTLKEIRAQKDAEYDSLNNLEKIQSELGRALKRLDVARAYGDSAADVIEQDVVVPEETISQIVGRQGANLKVTH